MTQDLSKKYSNFLAPKNQILINSEDILQKYGIIASCITVEEATNTSPKFTFTIEDPKVAWINTAIFEINKTVEIKMGYGNILETVITGEITVVKSIFSSKSSPQIEVVGERKNAELTSLPVSNRPDYSLAFGITLLSFTSIVTTANSTSKIQRIAKMPALLTSTNNMHCLAESIGLPEIKVGAKVVLAGLGSKFNHNYQVEKVMHSIDNCGYRTKFEAKLLLL
jgi:phage protein D